VSELGKRARRLLLVSWCSFLTAAVATMLVFAFVDPAMMTIQGAESLSRRSVYALGFLFFWGTGAGAALLALWMAGAEHERGAGP